MTTIILAASVVLAALFGYSAGWYSALREIELLQSRSAAQGCKVDPEL